MTFNALLIANRGEIAIRIARAAADLGIRTVAVHSEDDAASLHTRVADEAVALAGLGAAAYLNEEAIVAAAKASGCDAVHPGYGFLAERASFARRCAAADVVFVGPKPQHLELFGDKGRARAAAVAAKVPVVRGLDRPVSVQEAKDFFASLGGGAMIIKAIAGGGGRGTRIVEDEADIESAYQRCQSEAQAAFGVPDVYVEQFLSRARHVEVQILGDAAGGVAHLGERECSVQRRHQKVVEIAPAPALAEDLRATIVDAAVRFAKKEDYENLGTFEFLVDASGAGAEPFVFIETNARLQVEHTVTEEVTGVDIVQSQIRLAAGATLAELGLDDPAVAQPRGYAIQTRVNMETISEDGAVRPSSGTLDAYETPNGPGVRTDGFGYAGYRPSTAFDSLLAKVIVHSPARDFSVAIARADRALSEFRLEGVGANIAFLRNVLNHQDFLAGRVHTRWVDEHLAELAVPLAEAKQRFVAAQKTASADAGGFAGARVDSSDPLALFDHDAKVKAQQTPDANVAAEPAVAGHIGIRRHYRLHSRGRPSDGRDRQQSASLGRRHRLGRRRQRRPLHPTLRCVRHSRAQLDGLPGHDGGAGRGAHGPRSPLRAHVQCRRQPDDAAVRRGGSQGVRAGRAGDVRREFAGGLFHGGVAHRRVRRHEYRRLGEAGLPQGTGGDRGCGRTPSGVRAARGRGLRRRESDQRRRRRRLGRRDRPGGNAQLDRQQLEAIAAESAENGEEVSVHRHLVDGMPQ